MKILNKVTDEIINILNNDGIVIFPTETVYGIGANAFSFKAVNKIFEAKGRANDNPLIVHVSNIKMLESITKNISDIEYKLINNFMPGPFTLILESNGLVASNVTAGLDTVGVRIPKNAVAIDLITKLNKPIAAPSANISSRPSGTQISDIYDEFKDKINYAIDGGKTVIGIESTVCKVINNIPTILRPGFVTKEDIEFVIGTCNILDKQTSKPISPGQKYKHYAPNTKTILVYNQEQNKILELINKYKTDNTVIIGNDLIENYYHDVINYGNTEEEIAINLFTSLRQADKLNKDLIIIVGLEEKGLSLAIMERMKKASSNLYYK